MDIFIRETIGAIAIVCGIIAKWKLGNRDHIGWYWALVGGIFWTIFSCLIWSPMSFLNNAVYFALSIRGLLIWREDVGRGKGLHDSVPDMSREDRQSE